MKKKMNLVTAIFILIIAVITIKNTFVNAAANQNKEESQEILYQDVILTVLAPTINPVIDNYYKNILTESPFYDSTSIRILSIERPNGDRTSHFIINLEVEPFIGPHITVGKDRISLELSYPEPPKILKFEHLVSYKLPERYNDLYAH